jgi:hypothetical protein
VVLDRLQKGASSKPPSYLGNMLRLSWFVHRQALSLGDDVTWQPQEQVCARYAEEYGQMIRWTWGMLRSCASPFSLCHVIPGLAWLCSLRVSL